MFRVFSSSKPRFGPLFARDVDDLEVEASDDPEAFVSTFASPSTSNKPRFGPLFARDADDLEVEASDDPEAFVSTLISLFSSMPGLFTTLQNHTESP